MGGLVLMTAVSGCSLVISTSGLTGGTDSDLQVGDGGPDADDDARPDAGDDGGPTPTDPCALSLGKATYDFEGAEQGWAHGVSDNATGSWPFDPWTHGDDPLCPRGQCFGAERGRNYAQCQRGYLLSPKVDLAACSGRTVSLVFTHAHAFWSGEYNSTTWFDGGIVEISTDDGVSWQVPPASYPGTVRINPRRTSAIVYNCTRENEFHVHDKPGFVGVQPTTTTEIVLPAAALTSNLRVRFSQASGVSSNTLDPDQSRADTKSGWRIDDVHLVVK